MVCRRFYLAALQFCQMLASGFRVWFCRRNINRFLKLDLCFLELSDILITKTETGIDKVGMKIVCGQIIEASDRFVVAPHPHIQIRECVTQYRMARSVRLRRM